MTSGAQQMPVVAPPVWDNIPQEMAARQQWLLWRFESPKAGAAKRTKMPYYVSGARRTKTQGSDEDRQRLATLAVVRKAFDAGGYTGIGFAFLPDDGLIGIDIDGAIDATLGGTSKLCMETIRACDSFTEFSPSGKGVHIYVKGTTTSCKSNDIGLEMFCGSQFFTVTGRRWDNVTHTVRPISDTALRTIIGHIDAAKEAARAAKDTGSQRPAKPSTPAHSQGQGKGDDFARVNADAMARMDAWVPALLPKARPYKGGYRITSKELGRNLQEDLSIHPDGIQDFGLDQGFSPIDLVMEHKGFAKPVDAMKWLAELVGTELTKRPVRELQKAKPANLGAPAGVAEGYDDMAAQGGGGSGDGGADDGLPLDDVPDLIRHRGRPVDCRENVLYCLRDDPQIAGLVRHNTFTELHERSRETPWGRPAGEWDEEDDLMLGEYLAREHQLLVKATGTLRNGVLMAAREHKFNPIIDLIKSQPWDGVPRLEHWLTDVYEVEDRPYTRLIGKCFIMGMVMRAMRPGCKFDYMLLIKGAQGLSKSGSFRVLAEPWFTDNAIRMGDKDSLMTMQLVWIAESAELESLNKAETTAVKQFLSAQEDMYRPPYGAQIKKRPRHTVVAGTTNADTFLKDATGDRRFWPIEVLVVHLEILRQMRLQLFAEALHRLKKGEQYWPTRQEEIDLVFPEHEQFKKQETWEDYLGAYVNATNMDDHDDSMQTRPRSEREFFTTVELYGKALAIKADRIDGAGQMDNRLANSMKALGFKKHRETTGSRRRGWLRLPPPAPAETPAQLIGGVYLPPGAEDLPL